jgi:predicted TIM-barrel fold metal-dependent hydrolase
MIQFGEKTLPVVDADSHVVEPADVWTSRVPSKFADVVPQVVFNPQTNHHHWRIGSRNIWPAAYWATAGVDSYPPEVSWEFEDVDRGTFDPVERLKRMDEYGIDIQVLYPNIVGFESQTLLSELGPDVASLCTRLYNDFLVEWCSADPHRLIPIAMLPWWDVDASKAEMRRCAALGHRGVLFANKFERAGLPAYTEAYWDPVYGTAEELGLSVNFHVGFASSELSETMKNAMAETERREIAKQHAVSEGLHDASGLYDFDPKRTAAYATSVLMSQGDVLGKLLSSGLCDRFESLQLVAIESGFGYMPFYLECLDWHWRAFGGHRYSSLPPSEYFRRQCYGTFWFERTTLRLLDLFENNFMFSTDYPHSTSLSPGPASPASPAAIHLAEAFKDIDPQIAAKAVSLNAQRLYHLGRDT